MDSIIQNFSKNEYLIIFSAFIYGHITTNFFSGWAFWIQNRKCLRFSPDHIALSILLFLLMVDIWWVEYFRVTSITYGYSYFLLSLGTPVNLYILTTTIFPSAKATNASDLAGYFKKKEKMIYLLLGFNFVINLTTSTLLERSLFIPENAFRVSALFLCLLGLLTKRRVLLRALLIAGIIVLIVHLDIIPIPDADNSSVNFSFVEYLTIFTTFIYGFIASLFLRGWSMLLQRHSEISFSKEHLGWSIFAFFLLIDIWWGSWERVQFISGNFGLYLLSLTTPLAFFMLTSALFPILKNGVLDFQIYFEKNRSHIFSLFGLLMATNFIVANVMEEKTIFSHENILRICALLLAALVLRSRRILLHRVALLAAWALLIMHAVLFG